MRLWRNEQTDWTKRLWWNEQTNNRLREVLSYSSHHHHSAYLTALTCSTLLLSHESIVSWLYYVSISREFVLWTRGNIPLFPQGKSPRLARETILPCFSLKKAAGVFSLRPKRAYSSLPIKSPSKSSGDLCVSASGSSAEERIQYPQNVRFPDV